MNAFDGRSHPGHPVLNDRVAALEAELQQSMLRERFLQDLLDSSTLSARAAIADREAAEQAKREMTAVLAVISHELRTPLSAIFGYEELLSSAVAGSVTEQQQQYLGRIRLSAHQILELVDRVLQLSRIEAGREEVIHERVSPAAVAAEALQAIEPAALKKGLELSLTDETNGALIRTDGVKLRQILMNLLSNAAKFTPTGGIATVVRMGDDMLHVDVTDTGIGIAPDDLPRIFEPFIQADSSTTRRFGGTGLGLSVSRKLARLMGGDVVATSELQRGSTFTLRLPTR